MSESSIFNRQARWLLPRLTLPSGLVGSLGASLDIAVLMAASALAETSYNGWRNLSGQDLDAAIVASLVFLLIGKIRGLYSVGTIAFPERHIMSLIIASLFGAAAVVGLLFVSHNTDKLSRGVELLFALYTMVLALLSRLAFARLVRTAYAADRIRKRSVVLIGEEDEINRLNSNDWLRFGICENLRIVLETNAWALSEDDLERVALAIRLARASKAVEFALFLPWRQDKRIAETSEALRSSPLSVRLYPDAATRALLSQGRDGGVGPYLSIQLRRPPLGTSDRIAKRAFDIIVALTALATLGPAMLLVGFLVRATSPGPAIFRQTRRGYDGREFKIWKFRSMSVVEDGPNLRQAVRDDHRVTWVGRWLRRTSIDELPQLVNVLKGEMSLIGPRPHALAHDDVYALAIRQYALRRHVKPGLTGAAQAAGLRGETGSIAQMQARVARDVWYIDNWSLWLDIRIAFQTLLAVFRYEAF